MLAFKPKLVVTRAQVDFNEAKQYAFNFFLASRYNGDRSVITFITSISSLVFNQRYNKIFHKLLWQISMRQRASIQHR